MSFQIQCMKKYDIASSIILFILGVLLLSVPGGIVTSVIRIFGIIIVILGMLSIVNVAKTKVYNGEMVYGILIGVLGLVFISNPEVIASIIPFVFGVWIVIKSSFKLQFVVALKRSKSPEYIKALVVNIITLILGVVLVFNPFKGAEALIRIIGGFMIAYSLLDILEYGFTKPKKVKVIK